MYGLMHEVIYFAFTGLTTMRPHGEERKLYYVHTHRSIYTHTHYRFTFYQLRRICNSNPP